MPFGIGKRGGKERGEPAKKYNDGDYGRYYKNEVIPQVEQVHREITKKEREARERLAREIAGLEGSVQPQGVMTAEAIVAGLKTDAGGDQVKYKKQLLAYVRRATSGRG